MVRVSTASQKLQKVSPVTVVQHILFVLFSTPSSALRPCTALQFNLDASLTLILTPFAQLSETRILRHLRD